MNFKFFKTESNQRAVGFYFVLFFLGVAIDQVTKALTEEPFLNFQFAFSVPLPTPVMFLIYILVLAAAKWYLVKNFYNLNEVSRIAWTIIFAGAVSNVGERAVLGYVRDFIPLWGGILNVADFFILGGVAVLLWQELFPGLRKKHE